MTDGFTGALVGGGTIGFAGSCAGTVWLAAGGALASVCGCAAITGGFRGCTAGEVASAGLAGCGFGAASASGWLSAGASLACGFADGTGFAGSGALVTLSAGIGFDVSGAGFDGSGESDVLPMVGGAGVMKPLR